MYKMKQNFYWRGPIERNPQKISKISRDTKIPLKK